MAAEAAGERALAQPPDLGATILDAWRTNNRVTMALVRGLPASLLDVPIPETTRRTIRSVAGHMHNARCGWIKTLGREHGIKTPSRVDQRRVTPRQLALALQRSSAGIEAILKLGIASGGSVPPSKGYVWRNLALDVGHVLTYFVAHEAHHRGQIIMVARQLGRRLSAEVTNGMWQWKRPR